MNILLKKLIYVMLLCLTISYVYAQPTNLDFSSGNLNGWTLQEGYNQNSQTMSISNLQASTQYSVMLPGATEINTVTPIAMSSPVGGNFVRIGHPSTGGYAYKLSQTFTVDSSSTSLAFSYALIMDQGGHICSEQNYFDFNLKDGSGNTIPINTSNYLVLDGVSCNNSSGSPSYLTYTHFGYRDWRNMSYDLTNYIGAQVTIEMIVSGCIVTQGAHSGYAYFDASVCSNNVSPTSLTINNTPYPLLQSNSTLNLCGPDTTVIWAPVGATSFSWSGGAINGLTTQSVSIMQPGTYSLSCNKPFACSNSTNVSFIIGPVPVLTITPTPTAVCPNTPMDLTATGALSYTWMPVSGTTQTNGYSNIYHVVPQVTSVYRIIGKGANGCMATWDYTLVPLASPAISVIGNNQLCAGGTTTLVASGATSYTWSNGATTSSIIVTPSITTNYIVNGTSSSYTCAGRFADTVKVTGVGISSSLLKICSGGSITVTGIGATSYTWSTGATTNTVVLTPTVTTTYTVFGSSGGSCGTTNAVFTVSVNPLPVVNASVSPSGGTICSGNSVYVYGSGTATSYAWSGGITNNVNFTPSVSAIYTVTGTDVNGCKNTATQPISVIAYTVTVNPSYPICSGQSATLTILGTGLYNWFNSSTSQSVVVSPTVTTSYNVVASNSVCASSINTQVKVVNAIPNFSLATTSYTRCSANNASINLNGNNCFYSCSQPNTIVSPGIGPGFFEVSPLPGSPTVYTVTATNGCGVISNTLLINPFISPVVAITGPTFSCAGTLVTYTASGANSYSWNTGATTFTMSASPITNQNYFVVGTSTGGCTAQASLPLTIQPTPTVTVNNSNICSGNSTTLIANGANIYTWSTGATTSSIVVSPTVNSTYTVTGSSYGCISATKTATVTIATVTNSPISVNSGTVCAGNIFTILPMGGSSYIYSGGSSVVTPTANSTYTVSGYNSNGCFINDVISSVTLKPVPTITVNSATICGGQSFTMNPSGGTVYIYSNGSNVVSPTASASYTITGADANGCINTAVSAVTIGSMSTPTISVSSGTICEGNTFTITPTGASTYTYSSASAVVSPSVSSNYTITGSYSAGCSGTSSAVCSVVVNPAPNITVNNGTVCIGSSFTATSLGANTYFWSTGASSPSITVTPTINTIYSVTGTDLNSCSSTQTVSVFVDNACQDVWPGDANSDGIANNIDVLELGLHYNQTGSARSSTSNLWQPYFANNWTGTISNGLNLNHSDCNGDGMINVNDTLAIYNNYGLTHSLKLAQASTANPQLTIVPDQAAVLKGTWGTASIYLGDATTNINNINGVAFTVDFDNTLIEPTNIYIEYQNSFLDAGQNLRFRKLDFTNGKLFTTTTHTLNNNVTGNGLIAKLHYKILSSLVTDEVLNMSLIEGYKSEISGLITPLTVGTGTLMAIGASVGLQEFNGGLISISPNPTNGLLTVNSKTELQKIEVVSITGQVLLSETPTNVSHTLLLENFSNGVYFVNVYQNDRIVKREKIVLNK